MPVGNSFNASDENSLVNKKQHVVIWHSWFDNRKGIRPVRSSVAKITNKCFSETRLTGDMKQVWKIWSIKRKPQNTILTAFVWHQQTHSVGPAVYNKWHRTIIKNCEYVLGLKHEVYSRKSVSNKWNQIKSNKIKTKQNTKSNVQTYSNKHWCHQLWGTCPSPLTSNRCKLSRHFRAAQALIFDSIFLYVSK